MALTATTGNGDWNTPGNWNNGIPTSADTASVGHNMTVAAGASINCQAMGRAVATIPTIITAGNITVGSGGLSNVAITVQTANTVAISINGSASFTSTYGPFLTINHASAIADVSFTTFSQSSNTVGIYVQAGTLRTLTGNIVKTTSGSGAALRIANGSVVSSFTGNITDTTSGQALLISAGGTLTLWTGNGYATGSTNYPFYINGTIVTWNGDLYGNGTVDSIPFRVLSGGVLTTWNGDMYAASTGASGNFLNGGTVTTWNGICLSASYPGGTGSQRIEGFVGIAPVNQMSVATWLALRVAKDSIANRPDIAYTVAANNVRKGYKRYTGGADGTYVMPPGLSTAKARLGA